MRVACDIILSAPDRATLQRVAESSRTPQRLRLRAKIILRAADGRTNKQIAAELKTDPHTVGRWRNRFCTEGLRGLKRRPSAQNGNGPSKKDLIAQLIVYKTLNDQPSNGDRWTLRTLAAELGVSRSTVHRVWKAAGLAPHSEEPAETPSPSLDARRKIPALNTP